MEGSQLEARVQARAKRNEIAPTGQGTVTVYVTAPPEGGRANKAVVALLADRLGVAKSSISIVRGHRGRDKLLRIDGLNTTEVKSRLATR